MKVGVTVAANSFADPVFLKGKTGNKRQIIRGYSGAGIYVRSPLVSDVGESIRRYNTAKKERKNIGILIDF